MLATYGVGMLIGFSIAGQITDAYANGALHDWRTIWIYPAIFAAAIFVLFQITFRDEAVAVATENSARASVRPSIQPD
jgi:MFS family permease